MHIKNRTIRSVFSYIVMVICLAGVLVGCSLSNSIYSSTPSDDFSNENAATLPEELSATEPSKADSGGVFQSTSQVIDSVPEQTQSTGGRFVFSARTGKDQDIYEIFIVNADGSDARQVTNLLGRSNYPEWSPDGEKFSFVYNKNEEAQIAVMRLDINALTQLTFINTSLERYPSWSPDGKKIAFSGSLETTTQIYVMNADGSGKKQLTNDPSHTRLMN